jgi:hypothetical protein
MMLPARPGAEDQARGAHVERQAEQRQDEQGSTCGNELNSSGSVVAERHQQYHYTSADLMPMAISAGRG